VSDTVTEREQVEGELQELRPAGAKREQKLRLGDSEATYVQKPLSFYGKVQLFSVLGEAIDRGMSGPDGLSIDEVLGTDPAQLAKQAQSGSMEVDGMARAIARLASYSPELLLEVYCVALNVPEGERPWAKLAMKQNEEDGGLSDDDGIEIMETFLEQNEAALRDFFVQRLIPLFTRMRTKFGRGSGDGARSSKRSKSTRRTTQSAPKN